jgi:hypothetical protein
MSGRPINPGRVAFVIALAALAAGGFLSATKSFSPAAATGLDYFKGSWTVTLRSNPKEAFRWTVKEDLQGGWLAGVVEKNGEKVSTDFWRQNGKRIERFAFTAGGMFVKIESSGWESDRLVFTGVASDRTGETKIRETITKVNEREFHALWERASSEGKWMTFADEICTK